MGSAVTLATALIMATITTVSASAVDADPLAPYRDARLAYIDAFRRTGTQNLPDLAEPQSRLERLALDATGPAKAAALVELGTYRRLRNDFIDAVDAYQQGAALARALGDNDLLFEAELGTARAYNYGTDRHGDAADALERARAAAGSDATQTPKHRHDLATHDAQLLDGRGDLEPALTKILVARRLAISLTTEVDSARFYAELDLASIFEHFAELCDYTTITDAQTESDGPTADSYEACRRAVAQARFAFQRAAALADGLGWGGLKHQAEAQERDLTTRLFIIDNRAKGRQLRLSTAFAPHATADVIVSQNFEAGASTLADLNKILPGFSRYLDSTASLGYGPDPRREYMRGLARDMAGDREGALQHFGIATEELGRERSGFFDPRRRGTVIESHGEIVRDLAMRLLSLGHLAEAFDAFESVRARGLDEVRAALAASHDRGDRDWLARLLLAEATLSSKHRNIAAAAIALGPDAARIDAALAAATAAETNRAAVLTEPDAAERRIRLGTNIADRARLADVQQAAQASGTAFVFYWVVDPNIVVWHVGPDFGSSWVRTVLLPQARLQELIARLRAGLDDPGVTFDREAAQQLYLYLIASITAPRDIGRGGRVVQQPTRLPGLRGERIMFVPQGPLLELPFEVLLDPQEHYLVERWETAYAPNATEAVRSLHRPPALPSTRVKPVIGSDLLDLADPELAQIRQALGAGNVAPANDRRLTRQAFVDTAAGAEILHVYAHGTFATDSDPLLSSLSGIGSGGRFVKFTAAELVGVPVRDPDPRRLVVFSSCNGARVRGNISNEIFGFAWALLVSGTPSAVIARWAVDPKSNAEWIGLFYAGLAQGRSPAAATAAAMRAMHDKSPREWAAMQVVSG